MDSASAGSIVGKSLAWLLVFMIGYRVSQYLYNKNKKDVKDE